MGGEGFVIDKRSTQTYGEVAQGHPGHVVFGGDPAPIPRDTV